MIIMFRVDASVQIGSGHVMRCLTLAGELKKEGADCVFICREHNGNMFEAIEKEGYQVIPLLHREDFTSLGSENDYAEWLGTTQKIDAQQTIDAIQLLFETKKIEWLIVDHYSLCKDWEEQLRPYCKKLMIIDDLANREHGCDLLLDQTYLRDELDYRLLVPEVCITLTGSFYALLRPEFALWREYSLQRREKIKLKQLLITLGGGDKDNVTGEILKAIAESQLSLTCKIFVVLGANSQWLKVIQRQVKNLPWEIEVKQNVSNMAEIMANSDLCIGAAGSTAWERCCLGLPTIMLVLAENQQKIAGELGGRGVSLISDSPKNIKTEINRLLKKTFPIINSLISKSSNICNGKGAKQVVNNMGFGKCIRRMDVKDLELILEWRNNKEIRFCMFNQNVINFKNHKEWFEEKSKQKNEFLLIYENDRVAQGFVSFSVYEGKQSEAEWGFYKAPEAPKGTGKVMLRYAIDYGFNKIGLSKINAKVIQHNKTSLILHEKMGFLQKRTVKNLFTDSNGSRDFFHFSLTREEWMSAKNES